MLDLLLLNPPIVNTFRPPLGIPVLTSYLKKHGFKVSSIDLNLLFTKNGNISAFIRDIIESNNNNRIGKTDFELDARFGGYLWDFMDSVDLSLARLIGLSVSIGTISIDGGQMQYACEIAKYIRAKRPNVKLVLGGSYCTSLVWDGENKTENYLKYFDYICVGEGEKCLLSLCKGVPLHEIPNLVYSDGGSVQYNKNVDPVHMNEVACPDFSDFNLHEYEVKNSLYYQATRGCVYGKCAFCSRKNLTKADYKGRSVQVLEEQLLTLKAENPNLTDIYFVDEMLSVQLMEKVADIFLQNKELKGVTWSCFARISHKYTKDLAEKLYKSGLRLVQLGVESFSQRLLDVLNKQIKVEDIYSNIALFYGHNIGIKALTMYFMPTQTVKEVLDDYYTIKKYRHTFTELAWARFVLTRGCPLWYDLPKYGIDRTKALEAMGGTNYCWLRETTPIPMFSDNFPLEVV